MALWKPFAPATQSEGILAILGLGNPGLEYEGTRHNLGFMVIDRLASAHNISVRRRKFHSQYGEGVIAGARVVLLKPLTFVNASGLAAREVLSHFKAGPQRLLVICDDLNLPTGKLRLRRNGSAGGHHGLESIIEKLGTREFARLRIGIDHPGVPGQAVTDHVLTRFRKGEREIVSEAIERAADAVELFVGSGRDSAMAKCNRVSGS